MVRRLRHSFWSKLAALFILSWTIVDLSNASLCAQDRSDGPMASTALSLSIGVDSRTSVPQTPVSQIDDCFCCSHVVDVATVQPDARPIQSSLLVPTPASVKPHLFGRSLFHPPLL